MIFRQTHQESMKGSLKALCQHHCDCCMVALSDEAKLDDGDGNMHADLRSRRVHSARADPNGARKLLDEDCLHVKSS